jgi:hypothetical protein
MKKLHFAALIMSATIGLAAFTHETHAQSCQDRCLKTCQQRGATGSMMNLCMTRCSSGCEQTKSENKPKQKKQ